MRFLAIDGNSLVNRAFYGVSALSNSKGVPTNAIYGFLNMFTRLREDFAPDCICVCFDVHAPTFRHKKYDGYKATRRPMPEELRVQMPKIKEILDKMGIGRLECEGFEADDLLGTFARLCKESGDECIIVTGDRDSLQFIAQGAKVALVTTKMGTELYDERLFAEKYQGLTPDKIVDLKAIMGDSSDNIPGVRGIGEKGAMSLLCEFQTLDNVYANLDSPKISASTRKKLEESKETAYLSYWLASGCLEAPVPKKPSQYTVLPTDNDALYDILWELELKQTIRKLNLTPSGNKTAKNEFSMPEIKLLHELSGFSFSGKTVLFSNSLSALAVTDGSICYAFSRSECGKAFDSFISSLSGVTTHDCKSLSALMLKKNMTPPDFAFDTALAAYILDPTAGKYPINALAEKYFGEDVGADSYNDELAFDLFGSGDESLTALAKHCAAVHALRGVFEKELSATAQLSLLYDIELPLSAVLAEMENTGIYLDRERLSEFGASLESDIGRLETEIYAEAGEQFNIASPQQLSVILFEKLGLMHGKKNKKGGYSTDADILEKLRYVPIVEKILDYRKLTKLKSTYVEGLSKVAGSDGIIHGKLNQTVTVTGRLSSTEPNLQNIPVRRELGAEIRKCFTPRNGGVFVDADYSQIELRLLAHIANDGAMLKAFADGEDIHAVTASQVFNVPREMVTPQLRSRAKAVNFGIVYGISAFSLSEDIGVSVHEAQEYIKRYLEKYAGIREYMEKVKADAEKNGFVSTLYGRRRYIPELKSPNFNIRAFGQRAAMNAPVQGSAADIIKIAMIRVSERFKRENLSAKLVLQVHDELIAECPRSEENAVKIVLCEEMENAASLSVRLLAEAGTGENWYAAKS